MKNLQMLEWFGAVTAIAYSLLLVANVGLEFFGFVLLGASALAIGFWAYLGGHRRILLLQFSRCGRRVNWYCLLALIGLGG